MINVPTVVVLDNVAQEGLDLLNAADGIDFVVKTGLKGDELKAALAEADGAICRSGVKITGESIEGNNRLKAIVRAGVGTDNIDKTAATRQGVIVMNTPTGNTLSTAEHTFALMLALSRNISPAYESLKEARWDRKQYMGSQLADKTLGVVGFGRIGREVALRARAFAMKVMAFDPFLTSEQAHEMGVERCEAVDEMLGAVDYLTVHTPLTPKTENLINDSNLEKLKSGIRLINCARGGIFNEQALVKGLESGKIGGVALDVFPDEPCTDSPLFGMPGVLCTPHLGASTEEAQTQVAVEAVNLLVDFLTTGTIRHSVNMISLDPKTLEAVRGFLDVAHRLGLLVYQLHDGPIDKVEITYRGEVAKKDTKIVTASLCAGLLERALEEEVNVVNSIVLCRERGIEVVEHSNPEPTTFSSSITVEVRGDGRSQIAGGTLFGNDMPRLFRLGDYRLESYLDGILLVFSHQDVPGIIGYVGTALGSENVNIAQMSVGRVREKQGGDAIGVLNLDSMASDSALTEVLECQGIESAKTIELPPSGVLPSWL